MEGDATIFIIDDDDAIRDSLKILLESHGFTVEDFASARAFLASGRIGPGCALVDIGMPEMGGLELQRVLGERHPELPVIMITGQAEVPIAVQAMKAGALDFIEKPFDEAVLLGSVRQALARSEETARSRIQNEEAAERIRQLTPREKEVLGQLVLGHPNKVIAYNLSISPRTVEIHRARIMQKMEVRSLSELVRLALDAGTEVSGARPI